MLYIIIKMKNPPTMYLVETVGRALPCFRHGTDYILNLLFHQVPRRIMRKKNLSMVISFSHPSTTTRNGGSL